MQKGKSDKGILDIIILFAVGNRSSNRLLSMFPGVKPKVCASNGEESMDNILMITFYLDQKDVFGEKNLDDIFLRKILMISKLRGYIDGLGQLQFSKEGV